MLAKVMQHRNTMRKMPIMLNRDFNLENKDTRTLRKTNRPKVALKNPISPSFKAGKFTTKTARILNN